MLDPHLRRPLGRGQRGNDLAKPQRPIRAEEGAGTAGRSDRRPGVAKACGGGKELAMAEPNKSSAGNLIRGSTGDWEVVIGLEIHAQVASRAKLFSGAATEFGGAPNTH